MTIRFLKAWNGYSPDAVATLSAGLETTLKAAGIARDSSVRDGPDFGGGALAEYSLDPTTGAVTGLVGPDGGFVSLATPSPMVEVVTWTGNGLSQSIATSFNPDLVIVAPLNSESMVFSHRYTWRKNAPNMGLSQAHTDTAILLSSVGFSVSASFSASGVSYQAIVIADNGSGKLKVGSYAGNGVDNRAITVGFQPIFVAIKRDNVYPCWIRARGQSTSFPLSAAAAVSTNIKSLTSTGFTVGTSQDVNAVSDAAGSGGEAYDYFALADAKTWQVLSFVGSGASRSVKVADDTLAVLVKSADSGTPRAARVTTSSLNGVDKPVTGATNSGVMALASGAIELSGSAEVNGSNIANTVLAFRSVLERPMKLPPVGPLTAVQVGASGGALCLTNNPAFTALKGPFYLEAVLKHAATKAGNSYILALSQGSTGGQQQWMLWISGERKSLHVSFGVAGSATKSLETGIRIDDGNRHIIGFGFDGASEMCIDVDGKRVKVLSSITTIVDVAAPANAKFAIGCFRETADARGSSAVDCAIASARVYSSVLTEAQALARHKIVLQNDLSAIDVDPLEEWVASNVVGTTWFASKSATNNATLAGTDSLTTI